MQEIKLILFILIWLAITIMGFYFNKSKKCYTIIICTFLCLMLLCKDSYDIANYRRAYDEHIFHSKEWFFDYIRQLSWENGLSFDCFRSIWCIIIVILLYKGIKKYSNYAALVSVFFFIVPFLSGFITQMRNSLAGAIIVYALPFLVSDKKNDYMKYIICVIIASFVHIMSIIYLVLLIPRLVNVSYKNFHIFCIIGTCVSVIFIFNITDIMSLWIEAYVGRIPNEFVAKNLLRFRLYFQEGMRSNATGFFFAAGHQLIVYYYSLKAYNRCFQSREYVFYNRNSIEKLGEIMDLLLFIIPLYAISMQMQRIFFYCSPLFYGIIVQSNMELHNKKGNKKIMVPSDLLYLLGFLIGIYIISIYHTSEDFLRCINGMYIW